MKACCCAWPSFLFRISASPAGSCECCEKHGSERMEVASQPELLDRWNESARLTLEPVVSRAGLCNWAEKCIQGSMWMCGGEKAQLHQYKYQWLKMSAYWVHTVISAGSCK